MENLEEKKDPGMFKPALNHALLISAVVIVLTLVLYLVGQMQNSIGTWLNIGIVIIGLSWAAVNYRNQLLGGYISYGKALGYMVLVGTLAGVITGIFLFLLYGYISPELVEEARVHLEKNLYQQNPEMSYEEVQMVLGIQYFFVTPAGLLISSIFGGAIQATIIGLIAAIFIKKNKPEVFDV
ncbi:MAG: DUF4199 domain-containing protein [Bacteroidota bacterium]